MIVATDFRVRSNLEQKNVRTNAWISIIGQINHFSDARHFRLFLLCPGGAVEFFNFAFFVSIGSGLDVLLILPVIIAPTLNGKSLL